MGNIFVPDKELADGASANPFFTLFFCPADSNGNLSTWNRICTTAGIATFIPASSSAFVVVHDQGVYISV